MKQFLGKDELGKSSSQNNPVASVNIPAETNGSSALRGILVSPSKPCQPAKQLHVVTGLSSAGSAMLGLLHKPPAARTLSPFPKPSLSSALEAARYGPGLPRKTGPVNHRSSQQQQLLHTAVTHGASPAFISAIANLNNSPVKNAQIKPSNANGQSKAKGYEKDEEFKSKAKPGASFVSTRPRRGKQRRDFSDLLQDSESEEDESEVSNLSFLLSRSQHKIVWSHSVLGDTRIGVSISSLQRLLYSEWKQKCYRPAKGHIRHGVAAVPDFVGHWDVLHFDPSNLYLKDQIAHSKT